MAALRASDTISGLEGRAYAKIGGETHEMFYIKKLEAKVEKAKSEIKALGRRGTQHKAIGWSGTGTMTIYYMTSAFRGLMYDYTQTGKDTYFDIQVINEDPDSTVGRQNVFLRGVNLNSVIVALLDTGSETLEEEVEFTFEDVFLEQPFTQPAEG